MKQLFAILFSLVTLTGYVGAQLDSDGGFDPFGEDSQTDAQVKYELISSHQSIAPNSIFSVAVKVSVKDDWHSYYPNSGGSSIGTSIDWELPKGFEVVETIWPTPHITPFVGSLTYAYEGTQYILVKLKASDSIEVGTKVALKSSIGWMACDSGSKCTTPKVDEVTLSLSVTESANANVAASGVFDKLSSELPLTKDYGWKVDAIVEGDNLKIQLSPLDGNSAKLDKLYYFDSKGFTDSQKKQSMKAEGQNYILTIPLNPDKKPSGSLSGILSSSTAWITGKPNTSIQVSFDLKGTDASSATGSSNPKTTHSVAEASEAERTAAAALYDVNAKVPYVLLDGTKEESINLLTAVGLITLGGLLLNLMPCVFPVLGLKIMGFVQQAGEDPRKIKLHGMAFAAGVIASMWTLAGAIYALKYIWKIEFDWGDQLAYAPFLAAMILVLFVFGLNMAGVFELGTSLTGVGGELQAKKGYSGSFFSGVLTTLIATPCTGPFLGVVLGYTLAQPVITGMMLFTAFAIGISIPYIGLSFFPKLIQKLPRPGAWMVTFKSIMAFALFASAGYFFKSFASQTGTEGAWWFLMAIIVISLAFWAYGNWGTQATKKGKRYIWGYIFPVALVVLGIYMTKDATEERPPVGAVANIDHDDVTIHQWYPGIVEQNRAKGRIIWLDYTAEW